MFDIATNPEGTGIYDLRPPLDGMRRARVQRLRRLREARAVVAGLIAAQALGWDVEPEVAYARDKLEELEDEHAAHEQLARDLSRQA